MMRKTPLSVLELANVVAQGDTADAISRTVAVAQHVEKLGYKRLWMAEHHNMEHIASSATAVLIGHVAGHTSSIRVGSGGVMLPNHAPLIVAEQFGTLETIYPGRIDLGLGRAPGTDQLTAAALRRNNMQTAYSFPQDVKQLQAYLSKENHISKVRAFPGEGLNIPIWILGSSTDSAYLAAEMGLPYAFAAHFAPAQLQQALRIYRAHFRPSAQLQHAYAMACVNVVVADTEAAADLLATSLFRMFLGVITNQRQPLQPPAALEAELLTPDVQAAVNSMIAYTFTGSLETIGKKLEVFVADNGIDELMVNSPVYDLEAKLHSFSLLRQAVEV